MTMLVLLTSALGSPLLALSSLLLAPCSLRPAPCSLPMPLLELENLHAGYGPIEVLKGISVEVREGEIVTMIGANGAGKTTTLAAISSLIQARSGRIRFNGREIHAVPAHEIVRMGLCHSPEGRKIFPRLTVLENLQMGAFAPPRFRSACAAIWSMCSICSRSFASGRGSKEVRSPAASSRCWPSLGR